MLTSIKQLNIDANVGNGDDQVCIMSDWLARHGLERGADDIPYGNIKDNKYGLKEFFLLNCLINRGHYKVVCLLNNNVWHAIVAHTTEEGEVRFFDPNYGDFKFPFASVFKFWFENEFWPRSAYTCEAIKAYSYTATQAS